MQQHRRRRGLPSISHFAGTRRNMSTVCMSDYCINQILFSFFHLGELYMKRKASREQFRALANKRLAQEEWNSFPFFPPVSYQLSTPALPGLQQVSSSFSDCTALYLDHSWVSESVIGLIGNIVYREAVSVLFSPFSLWKHLPLNFRSFCLWCFLCVSAHYTIACVKKLVLGAGITSKSSYLFLFHCMFISMSFPVAFLLVLFSAGEVKTMYIVLVPSRSWAVRSRSKLECRMPKFKQQNSPCSLIMAFIYTFKFTLLQS